MTRKSHWLSLGALFALASSCVDDGGSEADPAPSQGYEDIEIVQPVMANPGQGIAGVGGDVAPNLPPDFGSVAGNTAFPPELAEIAGDLPPGVRPVEYFLPGFEGTRSDLRPDVGPNLPPRASFLFAPECIRGLDSAHVFQSTSTDPDGDPVSCQWTFPGGLPPGSGACVVDGVTFPGLRIAYVELVVDDGRGGLDSSVQVLEPCAAE